MLRDKGDRLQIWTRNGQANAPAVDAIRCGGPHATHRGAARRARHSNGPLTRAACEACVGCPTRRRRMCDATHGLFAQLRGAAFKFDQHQVLIKESQRHH